MLDGFNRSVGRDESTLPMASSLMSVAAASRRAARARFLLAINHFL